MSDHPMIEKNERAGYPENMVNQPEHHGIDFYGTEVLTTDDYFEDPNNGEIVMQDRLEDYVSEVYGFEFKTA